MSAYIKKQVLLKAEHIQLNYGGNIIIPYMESENLFAERADDI